MPKGGYSPEQLDARRAYMREYVKAWKARNPDKVAAQKQRRLPQTRILKRENRRAQRVLLASHPPTLACELCGDLVVVNWDHCHDCGDFRGWLCGSCNKGLGAFRDNPVVLRAAADFLESHRHTQTA